MRVVRRILIGWFVFVVGSAVAALLVRRFVPEFGDEDDDIFSLVAAMDGRDFTSTADALRSGEITAVMGGIDLDLTQAHIVDGATLSLRAFMGGMDVRVPAGWRVEVTSRTFMGGVANRTDPDGRPDDAPVLVVDTSIVMGGIDIRPAESD